MKKIDKGLEITKTKKVSGVVVSSETTVDPSPLIPEFKSFEGLAEVGFKRHRAINIGNFESEHVEVSLVLPCSPTKINKTFEECAAFVESKLEQETENILSNRAKDEF